MRAARPALALLGLLALAPAAGARELWSRGPAALEHSGSVKQVLTVTRGTDAGDFERLAAASPACALAATFPDCPAFDLLNEADVVQSLTRVRTRLDLRASPQLSAELVYDHELLFGDLGTLGDALGEGLRTPSLLDLAWDVRAFGMPDDGARWRHLLYRAAVKLETRRVEAVAGRQRIAWGVGRLWTPTDRFNAIPPLAIEQDQSPGVDALDLRWNFSGFSFAEAVYQPNGRSDDAAYGVRLHGSRGELDGSLLGGRWDGAWATGMDLAGNLGEAVFRLEAIWTSPTREVWPVGAPRPQELDAFWQLVASVDNNFDVGRGLYVLLEHLYNGNALGFGEGAAGPLLPFFESTREPPAGFAPSPGAAAAAAAGPFVRPASAAIFGGSRVITRARHLSALQLGYDFTPILRGDLLAIYDWEGRSAVFAPFVTYSPISSVELVLGAQLFAGPRLSEYGSAEHLGYFTAEWFF